MKVSTPLLVPRTAAALPAAASPPDAAPTAQITTAILAAGAFSAPLVVPDDAAEQCGEAVATLLETCGEGALWPLACAGGALGVVMGGLHYADARRRGDPAGMRAGLLRIGLGGLGVITGSGVLAGHPAIGGCMEAAKLVLGAAPPPSPVPTYGFALATAARRP